MCTGLPSILQSYFVRKPVGRQGPVVLIKLNGQILNTCSAHSYLNSTECSEEDSQEIWSGRRPHPQISPCRECSVQVAAASLTGKLVLSWDTVNIVCSSKQALKCCLCKGNPNTGLAKSAAKVLCLFLLMERELF